MRIVTNAKTINDAFQIASRAVAVRTTTPIIQGVLFSLEDEKLTLTGTDTDIRIESSCKVEGEDGQIVVPGKLFGDILKSLPNAEIVIETDGNKMSVECANSHFNITCMDASEFPRVDDGVDTKLLLPAEELKEMIDRTVFATSRDESRGIITGELFSFGKDSFEIVAIDGYRMAQRRNDLSSDGEYTVVLPSKAVTEISRVLKDGDVVFGINNKVARVEVDDTVISTRLLEGTFVDYNGIVPKDCNNIVTVETEALLDAVERALLISTVSKNNLIKMTIDEDLKITSSSEIGAVKEEVSILHNGDKIEIGFNGGLLSEVLKAIEDDYIKMQFKNELSAVVITPEEGDEYLYLVLPVRI